MSTKPVLAIDFGGVMSVHDRGAGTSTLRPISICRTVLMSMIFLKNTSWFSYRFVESRAIKLKKTIPGIFSKLIFVKNKLKKGDICCSIGASALIDDSFDVLQKVKSPCIPIWFGGTKYQDWITVSGWNDLITLDLPYQPPTGVDCSNFIYTN